MTGERRAQLIALLGVLNDGLPEPSRRDHSTSGFVNEPRERTCPDCMANGRVMFGCETCGGSGKARTEAIALVDVLPDDGQVRDPYAVNDRVTAFAATRRLGHVPERDAEIDRARKLARDRPASELAAAQTSEPFLWEREREALRRRYDIDALTVALDVLRDRDERGYHLLHAVYVYGWLDHSTVMEAAVERALLFLDERMPDPMRAPGAKKHPALARFDRKATRNAAA